MNRETSYLNFVKCNAKFIKIKFKVKRQWKMKNITIDLRDTKAN